MHAFGIKPSSIDPDDTNAIDTSSPDDSTKDKKEDSPSSAKPTTRSARKTSGPKAKQTFSIVKDLDLVNGGSPSFSEFVNTKNPTSVVEKCLASVYWLSHHTHNAKPVTVEQVYTCFKFAHWTVPNDLVNTLQQAGSKGWLDSRKRDDLKVVIQGENHIEHNMPAKPKGK